MKKILSLSLSCALLLLGLLASCSGGGEGLLQPRERLQVATTTSLYDTGLWSYLEPMFEEKYDVELDVLYAGTGIALEYGQRGDVDVIAVHSKSREVTYIEEGYGIERVPFAFNYFLIVGPENDPAGISGMLPEDAFKKLFDTGSTIFVSRGDESGTHSKERSIWASAGYEYTDVKNAGEWYVEGGRGMGPTLLMTNEMRGYTLTDIGTFLSYKGEIGLVPIVDKGAVLLNVYSIIAGNSDNVATVNAEMAQNLVDFIISDEIQHLIGNYGIEVYGMQLFTPCAGNEPVS